MSSTLHEHAMFIMGRYDNHYDSVNNKGVFYITLNTFLLGGLFAGFTILYDKIDKPFLLWVGCIFFSLSSVISSILVILAINPFLKSGDEMSARPSLLFFGSAAQYQHNDYLKSLRDQTDAEREEDMAAQIWQLSQGLCEKYRRLSIAGKLLIVQLILLIPIIYYITSNLVQHESL
jgi:hypothetical protein